MAAANVTVIGRSARVRGRLTGASDLEIHGFVEGEVAVDGDLTIGETGLIGSDLSGRRIVVRGAVRGNITGDESVSLEDGAKVVGDVKAPRVAIGAGALVRGHVQTAGAQAGAARPRAPAASAARPAPKSGSNVHAVAAPRAATPEAPAAVPAARPSTPRAVVLAGGRAATNHAPVAIASKKAPPPPVVPALKKGAKGALAKKR